MIKVSSHVHISAEDIQRYRTLFVGRASDFAYQEEGGRYVRAGRPLTEEDIYLHLLGVRTLGTYVINEQGGCRFCVLDADRPDGLRMLRDVQRALARDGYPSYLELSNRAGHLWLFFQEEIPASQVRAWFLPYCPQGVEFFPKQSQTTGYGSLIRLPLGIHRKSGQRYPFVQWKGTAIVSVTELSLSAQLAWLEQIERIPVPAHRRIILHSEGKQPPHTSLTSTPIRHLPYAATTIQAWCAMQNPLQVIRNYVELDSRGIGHCPFGSHHDDGIDQHPSFRVYEPHRPGGSCWYCYAWQRGGNVFNFLCQWHNVDARTLWHWIQEGKAL